jgi:N,N'-diacetyllegionaminate synthase
MNKVFIIAEAGVNHNGKLDLALKLCDIAREAGADAIKFQTWKTENIVTKSALLATYQEENTPGSKLSQFEMLKKLELSYNSFVNIKNYCLEIGINFLSTPDDEESLTFLISLGIDFIKVGSGEINNIPFLRKIGSSNMPVILSTGMAGLGEVERAYNYLIEAGASEITLLHCTTNYPCPMSEVNLTAMLTLKNAFKCKVGYSDHTEGIEVPIAAVALGAEMIEKHFTIDKSLEGPDHKASLDPSELAQMVKAIRNIENALGNGIKRPNQSEIEISKGVLKRIVAKRKIYKGEILSSESMAVKRSSSGISSSYWDLIDGSVAEKDYETDDAIQPFFADIIKSKK